VLRDLTLLDLPVLLLAQLELTPSMEFVNVSLDLFTLTNVSLHALLDTEPLEDNALNALTTVLAAQDHHLLVLHALMDMLLMLLLVFAKLPPHANSVNISQLKTIYVQEYAQLDILIKIQYVSLDVFQDSKIMGLEVVSH